MEATKRELKPNRESATNKNCIINIAYKVNISTNKGNQNISDIKSKT